MFCPSNVHHFLRNDILQCLLVYYDLEQREFLPSISQINPPSQLWCHVHTFTKRCPLRKAFEKWNGTWLPCGNYGVFVAVTGSTVVHTGRLPVPATYVPISALIPCFHRQVKLSPSNASKFLWNGVKCGYLEVIPGSLWLLQGLPGAYWKVASTSHVHPYLSSNSRLHVHSHLHVKLFQKSHGKKFLRNGVGCGYLVAVTGSMWLLQGLSGAYW